MRKIRYFIMLALCAMGITSCQDDLMNNSTGVNLDNPVQVDLDLTLPKSMQVEITRADNSKSDITSLRLYLFSTNSGTLLSDPQDATDITLSSTGTYTAKATLYEGVQKVYAVANLSTVNYWESPQTELDAAAESGETAFLETLYTLQSSFLSSGTLPTLPSEEIPLSGVGEVTVNASGSSSGTVTMKRPMAQIKFNIGMTYDVTTGERSGHKVSFTPESYSIYRVAGSSYVFGSDEASVIEAEDGNYYDVSTPPVSIDTSEGDTARISGFYIPENIQVAKETCNSYNNREAFSAQSGDSKTWTYAPDNATYVVISGKYVETDENGSLCLYADVKYTIHLGAFSADNWSDFSVKRNYIYTYKVSVRGVENIITEATAEEDRGDFQNGAEGDVIEVTDGSEVFYLDSHYEQVVVSYNLSSIAAQVKAAALETDPSESDIYNGRVEELIAQSFMLSVQSPMNTVSSAGDELLKPYSGDESDMDGLDLGWIKFYPQSDANIHSYTSTTNNAMLTPWQACQKMGEAVKELVYDSTQAPTVSGLEISSDNGEYYARFTVFVDEYFYTEDLSGNPVDWADFTRADARTLLIASDWTASLDGNSTYATARTYISQASIQTFYNPDSSSDTNALGVESYNEYGVITGFGSVDGTVSGDDNLINGRKNMIANIASSRGAIDFTKIGYTEPNVTTGNEWSLLSDNDKVNAAYKACLARNRDLNRNGQIDDDEIRWYLPARSQYLRMGIGANSLTSPLFTGNKAAITNYPFGTNYSLVEDGSLYYSNTPTTESGVDDPWELYWAIEVGAYGSNRSTVTINNVNVAYGSKAQIRCVRNLPSAEVVQTDSYGDGALAEPVYGELKRLSSGYRNALFDFGNRLDNILHRTTDHTGPYSEHNETSTENMLPGAFVVARANLSDTYTQAEAYSYSNNPCASYSELSDRTDRGIWRVPNLSELTVMSTVADELSISSTNSFILSSTQFSNSEVRCAFYYNGKLISASDPGTGESDYITNGYSNYIRCVRDATTAEVESATAY